MKKYTLRCMGVFNILLFSVFDAKSCIGICYAMC